MKWEPIETAPEETDLLIYGEHYTGKFIVTGGSKDKYGWDILGCGGYECETGINPTHWAYPETPNYISAPQ
jgi:hypothetical protein